jgi:NACHT domain
VNLPTSRTIITILLAVALFTMAVLTDLLIEITGSQIGDYLMRRFRINTPTLIYALIGILLVALIFNIYRKLEARNKKDEPQIDVDNIDKRAQHLRDALADLYQQRYEKKLDNRLELALEVRADWNRRRVELVKEKFDHVAGVGNAIEVVSGVFAEKGRLLVIGKPGAGKTVLLLKLAVSLLNKPIRSADEPFPIIFNLASWSEEYSRFEDWLEATLQSGYGLSQGFAKALLNERRITLLLDGLDELGASENAKTAIRKRAECLNSLNRALNRGVRVVICCRVDEFMQMKRVSTQDAPVSAVVTILDLTPRQIRSALLDAAKSPNENSHRDSTAARNLLDLLKQKRGRMLLDLLCTPYYLTIALEVFDSPIAEKLLLPSKQLALQQRLLARFVERKLQDTPNPHRYKHEQVLRWLNWLAVVVFASRRSTFELSNLQTYHIQLKSNYAVVNGACMGLLTEACFMLAFGLDFWGFGFPLGALGFSLVSSLFFRRLIVTEDIRRWKISNLFNWQTWRRAIFFIVTTSLAVGCFFKFVANKTSEKQVSANHAFWFGALTVGAIIILQIAINSSRVISFYTYLKSPYQRLRSGIEVQLAEHTIMGLLLTLSFRYVFGLGFSVVVFGTLLVGLSSVFASPIGRHFMVRLCLRFENRMPLRYVSFLDYASEAGFLEKDGGHWRFRHQNLQHHFGSLPSRAKQASSS